jgi:multidrug efflux pump subunit AcrA (membrane-fusion protein)
MMKSLLPCILAACVAQAEVHVGVLSPSKTSGVSCGVQNAEVTKIFVAKGDRVTANAPLAELSGEIIRAPFTGRISKVYKRVGDKAVREEKVFDVVDIDTLNARFYVPARLRRDVKENSEVGIQVVGFPMLILPATVSYVDSKNDAASGLMQIKLKVQPGANPISAGMQVLGAIGN